jgi:predicted Zn finger-like uncharacterized protein
MIGVAYTPAEAPSVFTQCSKCDTVFKLSAQVLRAAGGQVRCGRCGEVFNALARLAEESTAFTRGESSLDLETRADAILESLTTLGTADEHLSGGFDGGVASGVKAVRDGEVAADGEAADGAAAADDVAPGVEIAHLQFLDPLLDDAEITATDDDERQDPSGDISMEFTLPPGELDRIFIEPRPSLQQRVLADDRNTERGGGAAERSVPPVASEVVVAADDVPQSGVPAAEPRRRVAGLEVSEDVRQAMLAVYRKPGAPEIEVPHLRDLPRGVWLSGAIVLAALLGAQIIHANRDWLATHAPLRSTLRSVYSMVGVAVSTPPNLSAYQLRQWGVTGDPAASGTLRVRASLLNATAQLQPYPLLRVTLANRFGTRIGGREFEPAEYLGRPTARLFAPGEQVDATLDILDPGKDAEGFEIDVCLRGADRKLACAGDAAPQVK